MRTPAYTQGFGAGGSSLGKPDTGSATQRFRIIQVSLNGGHNHAGINRDQVKARELEAYPGVNDDAFVQYAIQDIEKAGAAGLVFDDHGAAKE